MNPEPETFFTHLSAAVAAGAPLEVGSSDQSIDRLTTKRLESVEALLEKSPRTRSALEVFETTGSMGVVLECLSLRVRARSQVLRLFRRTFFYLVFLTLVAIVGMIIFRRRMLPELQAMHHDLVTLSGIPARESRFVDMIANFAGPATIVFVVFLVLLLVWMLLGGIGKTANFLGAKAFLRFKSLATAIESLRLLLACGVSKEKAIGLVSDLAALDEIGKAELVVGIANDSSEESLSAWSKFLRIASRRCWQRLQRWGTFVIVGAVGGVIAMVYCLLLFSPLFSLLLDLALRGRA